MSLNDNAITGPLSDTNDIVNVTECPSSRNDIIKTD